MSTTPRYSTVSISAQRAREAAAAAAAERRRLAEAARRRAAELAERKHKYEERQRQMVERHQARDRQIREASGRSQAAAGSAEPNRRSPAPDRRRREVPPMPQAQRVQAAKPSGQAAEPAIAARAEAEVLIEALSRWSSLQETVGKLREASRRLADAIDVEDERAATAATAAVREVVAGAHAEHDALQEARARRHIIADGVAAALPEHYRIGEPTEDADGSIRFRATGPDDDLLVAVLDDGTGADIAGYRGDGREQPKVPPGMDDCPGLTRELEDAHRRAAADGLTFGPVTWQGAADGQPRRKRRSAATQRQRAM